MHASSFSRQISSSVAMKILLNMGDEILWVQYKNVKHAQVEPLSPQTATWEGRPEASKTLMFMHTTD